VQIDAENLNWCRNRKWARKERGNKKWEYFNINCYPNGRKC